MFLNKTLSRKRISSALLAVFYKNWWQKFQKVCDRAANVETDEEEENDILKVFCNLSSRNDSIKKLLNKSMFPKPDSELESEFEVTSDSILICACIHKAVKTTILDFLVIANL
ncbi:hypothetical protein Avbf_17084 [Armadillidium vulgare]|nr:hypothetical protein Avbf_17084 [Armadillidium vulgare]